MASSSNSNSNSKSVQKECSVCVEGFNKSTRKPITCAHCEFVACATCVCRVLTESTNDPQCMQCAKAWGKDFIVENFTKKFVNDTLKKHRENQLFERERGLLPATQPLVERQIQMDKLAEERVALLARKIELQGELVNIHNGVSEIGARMASVRRHMSSAVTDKDKRQFVRRCPVGDCKGFLSTVWKCGLCETWTCPDCHEPKGTERDAAHECKPENVETAKLLAKDTKPCPKCAVPIHRIMGCNQMFCTNCHTPFDWHSLKMSTGPIHNPHYFEMRQRIGAAPVIDENVDGMCGDGNNMPDVYRIVMALQKHNLSVTNVEGVNLSQFVQWANHINDVTRRQYIVDNLNDNVDLRIKYMMNLIDEARFKHLLQKREKSRSKKREIDQVLSSMYALSGDIIRQIMRAPSINRIRLHIRELTKLIPMATEGLENIERKYGGVVPKLTFEFKPESRFGPAAAAPAPAH